MSKYYSFGSCVVAVDHQCWCEGSAYQKQQDRARWDIYVTFTPRRGISPLRPSLLVPEPRLLLKLVTRIAAFPILESRGSVPASKWRHHFSRFINEKSLEDLESHHCHLFGRGQGNALWGHRLEVGMWGNRGVLQVLLITKRLERWGRCKECSSHSSFIWCMHYGTLDSSYTVFRGLGQIQGKIWWQQI